jgi:hypothetical protein
MTLHEFLNHWGLMESPFQGEEARTDRVFGRMIGQTPASISITDGRGSLASYHAEFERVLGDLRRPGSAVVFGEKGSGKTALRLQIAAKIREHNADNPDARVLLVAHDDLNTMLLRIHDRYAGKTPQESFQKIRLVDHLDAILNLITARLTDAMLGDPQSEASSEQMISIGVDAKKTLRRLDPAIRRDLLLLQALYDRAGPEGAPEERTRRLRRRLGLGFRAGDLAARVALVLFPLGVIGFFLWGQLQSDATVRQSEPFKWGLAAAAGFYLLLLLTYLSRQVIAVRQLGRRMRKQIPTAGRGFASFARSLVLVGRASRMLVPTADAPETRYALFERLRRALSLLGYTGVIVVIDRVDEPPMVAADPDRMRSIIWPLFNNKLLQFEGLGLKMLLPIELRHALYKESSAFFQEARLDKQGFVDRLSWSGTTLYDLCNGRLRACTRAAAMGMQGTGANLSLIDMFAEDVSRQDLCDALEQMHQPRDAFKFLYRCIAEHCASASTEAAAWRIPRFVLEVVRKQEVDRVQALYRGIRPA